jgi:DNA-binding NtrC family response regulator
MQRISHLEPTEALDGTIGLCKVGCATVLIVERELRLRSALNASFLRHGWDVTTATCIQECLRAIERHIFDLVICELRMRDGDVHEVMLSVAEETPVIVLAENAITPDVVKAMRNGAFDVLLRDVSFDVLQVAARAAVESSIPKTHIRPNHGIDTKYSTPQEGPCASVMTLSELSRTHLEAALASADGNRTNAARILGISVRTVRNKVKQYGLPPRRFV